MLARRPSRSVQERRQTPLAGSGAATGFTPTAWSGPTILEESARLQSPDAQLPLNGPIAIHGNRIVAGGIVAIESQWRCAAFLSKGASSIERRSQLLPGPGTRCDLKRSTIDCVYLNGALVLEARDGVVDLSNTRGRYGLITNAAAVDFDDVRVTQP